MPKFCRLILLVFFCIWSLALSQTQPGKAVDPKQWLAEQIQFAESVGRNDLLQQAISRLLQMDPNSVVAIAAQFRFDLRQNKMAKAQKELVRLQELAPDSKLFHQAQQLMALSEPANKELLDQARILNKAGKVVEAKALYDKIFQGQNPPDLALQTEYWILASRVPNQELTALPHLLNIYSSESGNQYLAISTGLKQLVENRLADLYTLLGSQTLKNKNPSLAKQQFLQAIKFNADNGGAYSDLGDAEMALHNFAAAEEAYKKAFLINKDSGAAWGLAKLYRQQSLEKAISFIQGLPQEQLAQFQDYLDTLKVDLLQDQATQLVAQKKWAQAAEKYQEAYRLAPSNVWLVHHYAQVLQQLGKTSTADQLFKTLAQRLPNDPEQVYAYALYLSASHRDQLALNHLHSLAPQLWNENIRSLAQNLSRSIADALTTQRLNYAKSLRAQGQTQGASNYLQAFLPDPKIAITLGDWALEAKDYPRALYYYRLTRQQEPTNFSARLGEIEVLVAENQLETAKENLISLSELQSNASADQLRREALAWYAVGQPSKGLGLLNQLKPLVLKEPPGETPALIFRDAARIETELQLPDAALNDYRYAMVASGITPVLPVDNAEFTYLMRNDSSDDWLKRSIRSDADELYRQQDTNFTLDNDNWFLTGTPGYSQFYVNDSIAELSMPFYDGRQFFRADSVFVDAGRFYSKTGFTDASFGTCSTLDCRVDGRQTSYGTSLAWGWRNDTWAMDIGSTPIGFLVVHPTGGINYSSSLFHLINWTLTASQRPITNSMLSFAGRKDPNTGTVWGGDIATGLTLSSSYDRGGRNGLWSLINAAEITGKNVPSNQQYQLMYGYYYKLINEDNRRFSIGLNNLIWHYTRDLNSFTLGQGGYYSPQQYFSLALPISYRQRLQNWSFVVETSVNWTKDRVDASPVYPIHSLVPDFSAEEQNEMNEGSSSSAIGYTLLAAIERRLSSHFVLGASVDIQRTPNYVPSHASIYIRYSAKGWQGDLNLPPLPALPYAEFR